MMHGYHLFGCYDFQKQDLVPELIPEYELVKENYEGKG